MATALNGGGIFRVKTPEERSRSLKVLASVCVHRQPDPETYECLLAIGRCPDPAFRVEFRSGDALIDRSRSIVATQFLERKDFPVLFFIDDDVIFNPFDAVKLVQEMMENDLDISGAAYVKKQKVGTNYAVKLLEPLKGLVFGEEEGAGLYEARSVSTGFMAIQRRVFEKMVEMEQVHLCSGGIYPFFKPEERFIENRWVYMSEDWAFTERARDLGFKVWLDTSINLKHAGRYVYDQDDMLKKEKENMRSLLYWEADGKADFKRLS